MKCPYCKDEGERSKVFVQGGSTTLMSGAHFDEGGRWVDPNYSVYTHHCSRGHEWQDKERGGVVFERSAHHPLSLARAQYLGIGASR